jgi:hypothetical protein
MFVDTELGRGSVMCLSLTPQIADVAATLELTRHSSRNRLWLIDYKKAASAPTPDCTINYIRHGVFVALEGN